MLTRWQPEALQPSGAGQEMIPGVFGIDATLHRPSSELHLLLAQAQRQSGGDSDLFGHDVDAADHLRDRMLTWMRPLKSLNTARPSGQPGTRPWPCVDTRTGESPPPSARDVGAAPRSTTAPGIGNELLILVLEGATALTQVDHIAV